MKEKKRKNFGYSSPAFPLSFLKRRRKGIEEENSIFSSLLFPNRMEKEKEGERGRKGMVKKFQESRSHDVDFLQLTS